MKTLRTGVTEVAWKETQEIENAHLQYNFGQTGILMNYINDELRGAIAPTDSRLRPDLRLYEEGKMVEAEKEKRRIENIQRARRRKISKGEEKNHEAQFFEKVDHPYVKNDIQQTNENPPIYYKLKDGEDGYWQRRNEKKWDDMADLWGGENE